MLTVLLNQLSMTCMDENWKDAPLEIDILTQCTFGMEAMRFKGRANDTLNMENVFHIQILLLMRKTTSFMILRN